MRVTVAQKAALAEGGLSPYCLTNHSVCPHCGACRQCASGCGCDRALDGHPRKCGCGGCKPARGDR